MEKHSLRYIFACILTIIMISCNSGVVKNGDTYDPASGKMQNHTKIGNIKPKKSSEITGSYWGVQAGSLADSIMEKAAELGVKWTRLHARWEHIEKEKGEYQWEETDEAFEAVLKYGITPFVTLGQGHRMYSGTGNYDDPKLAEIYGESPAPPVGSKAEMDAWLNFVGAVINRYKDRIQYWEIWNEPNHRKYWGAPPNGEDYGRLVKATVEKIRSIQPEATIAAGSMAGIHADYAEAFLSQCDPYSIDVVSFHNYAPLPEDRLYRMTAFMDVINKYNPELVLWQGECGYPSHSRTTGFRGRAPWGLNIQAKWLLRQSFVDTYFCNATISNYFILAHDGLIDPDPRPTELTGLDAILGYPERGGSRVHNNGINQKCILFRETQKPKPAFYAYQNLCAAMDDRYKVFKVDYKFDVVDQGDFYGIGAHEDAYPSVPLVASYKTKDGKPFVAYWLPWNPQENIVNEAKVALTVDDLKFDNPVLVDLLTGDVYQLDQFTLSNGSVQFKSLPLADYPMAIVERNEIAFDAE